MQFILKTEVKHLQMPGVRCSELCCFIIYWKTGSSTVEKMLRNCTGDWLHKGVGVCGDFCKNVTENHRMEKGVFTHEERDLEPVGKCMSDRKVELRAYWKHVELSKVYCIFPEKIAIY